MLKQWTGLLGTACSNHVQSDSLNALGDLFPNQFLQGPGACIAVSNMLLR